MKTEHDHFCTWAREALASRHIHTAVQRRLSGLLADEFPDNPSIAEVFGIEGGRNDLICYYQSGRRAVFELFCSPSQVPQDLRLLEQSKSHWKFAILLDREINATLAETYFHKKPDPFPFLWLSQVMMPSKESDVRSKLRQLLTTEPFHDESKTAAIQNVAGDDNIVAHAERDIHINQKKVLRHEIAREPGDATEETLYEIQELIKELAKTDELAGKTPSYAEWQSRLKNRFKVASYRKLTIEQGAAAIRWLKQELGRKLPSLRRTNNGVWLKRVYTAIWAAANELHLGKPQVYQFAFERLQLKRPISSLKELGEQNLEALRDKLRYEAKKLR